MRVQKRRRLMTLIADDELSWLEIDVGRVVSLLNAVAGSASALNGGMNVISGRVVGMAFQAV